MKEPTNELLSWQGHWFPALSACVFAVESDLAIVNGDNAVIGDGHPMNISSQIVQYLRSPLNCRFAQ